MKQKIILLILLIITISACQKTTEKTCKDFYDCIPNNIHPGETGCGGCFQEGESERCYEWTPTLCESYKQNYSCIDGLCTN